MFTATGGMTQPRAVGKDSSLAATATRVFPVAVAISPSEQFQTTHKANFRRELHAPNPIIDATGRVAALNPHLPRRADQQQAQFLARAQQIHAERQAAAAAAAAAAGAAEAAELANPFHGRAPINRRRDLAGGPTFTSEEAAMAALSAPAQTIYADGAIGAARTNASGSKDFGKDVTFSRPIEEYKGTSRWRHG
jgi:hypothetical protein